MRNRFNFLYLLGILSILFSFIPLVGGILGGIGIFKSSGKNREWGYCIIGVVLSLLFAVYYSYKLHH